VIGRKAISSRGLRWLAIVWMIQRGVVRLLTPLPNHALFNLSSRVEAWWITVVGEHKVQVMGSEVEDQRDLRAISADVLHHGPIGAAPGRIDTLS